MATWTWNPSDKYFSVTISGGNLTASTGSSESGSVRSIPSKSSGKWYWEITVTTITPGTGAGVGVGTSAATLGSILGFDAYGWGWQGNGWYRHNNVDTSAGVSLKNGDIAQVALDLDSGEIWFGKNGTWNGSGNPATGDNPVYTSVTGTLFPMVYCSYTTSMTANFGASAFSYTEPSGFMGIALIEASTTETTTLTDTAEALHLVDSTSETATLTDTADALHLVDSTSETATLTDTASRVIEAQRSTAETATLTDVHSRVIVTQRETTETVTLTDVAEALHLVDYISDTATLTDVAEADELIRKKIRFPNLQGKHLSLKFESATSGSFAIYYLRHKMFKTRELCSDQKHPNTQGSHIGVKLSNSGSDAFTLMYVSQEMQLVTS